jgi:hypothetical protein
MPAAKLHDLFNVVAKKFDVGVKIIGRRPGEKTHEDLMAAYELKDTFIDEENGYESIHCPGVTLYPYITIPHADADGFFEGQKRPDRVYSSDGAQRLTDEQIWDMLEFTYNNTWKD